jgi:hypothetical protein
MPWNFYKKVNNIQVLICCTQHAKPMWKQVESRGTPMLSQLPQGKTKFDKNNAPNTMRKEN